MAKQQGGSETLVEGPRESATRTGGDVMLPLALVLGGLFVLATGLQAFVLLEVAAARDGETLQTVLRMGTPTVGMLGVGFGLAFLFLRRTLDPSTRDAAEPQLERE